MSVKVLFINAIDPHTEADSRYPPLGLAYLISSIKKEFGEDRFVFRLVADDIEGHLDSFAPDIVGISSVSQNYNFAKTYAAAAKQRGIPVVIGGVHVSLVPESMTADMDVACIGESENTIVDLFGYFIEQGMLSGSGLHKIPGIAFREEGVLRRTSARENVADLDSIPIPDRTFLAVRKHAHMISSRGCPMKCSFCSSSHYWNKVRFFSAEYVIEEIEWLIEHYGVNLITFYDDLFIASRKRIREMADLIERKGINKKVSFSCSSLAHLVNDEIAASLARMGVKYIALGLESGNQRVLNYHKGSTASVEQNSRAVTILQKYGIRVNATFMIGAPDETRDEIMDTYEFIKRHRFNFMSTFIVTPVPGTPLWTYALERGLVTQDMDWSVLNMNAEKNPEGAIILSETLSREELIYLLRKFRRLRFWKNIQGLPTNPMIADLPRVAYNYVRERLLRVIGS